MNYVLVRSASFVELHHRLETELLKSIAVYGIDSTGRETTFTNSADVSWHLFSNVTVSEVKSVLAAGEVILAAPINETDIRKESPRFKIKLPEKLEKVISERSTPNVESESSKLATVCVAKSSPVEMKEAVQTGDHLIVPINKHGIEYIKIPANLKEFIIKMKEGVTSEELNAPYCCIKPSSPELGHMYRSSTSIEFCGCISIKEELSSLAKLYPGISEWRTFSEFNALGLVHTIQYPLGKLKLKEFINEEQFALMNNFIKKQADVAPRLEAAKEQTTELESKRIAALDPVSTKGLAEVSLFPKADCAVQRKVDKKVKPKHSVVTGIPFR